MAKKIIGINLDCSGNEVQSFSFEKRASAPTPIVTGQVYFNTTKNEPEFTPDGVNWVSMSASGIFPTWPQITGGDNTTERFVLSSSASLGPSGGGRVIANEYNGHAVIRVVDGGTATGSFPSGALLFGNGTGVISTNASGLFYDNVNECLGIGRADLWPGSSPEATLHVGSGSSSKPPLIVTPSPLPTVDPLHEGALVYNSGQFYYHNNTLYNKILASGNSVKNLNASGFDTRALLATNSDRTIGAKQASSTGEHLVITDTRTDFTFLGPAITNTSGLAVVSDGTQFLLGDPNASFSSADVTGFIRNRPTGQLDNTVVLETSGIHGLVIQKTTLDSTGYIYCEETSGDPVFEVNSSGVWLQRVLNFGIDVRDSGTTGGKIVAEIDNGLANSNIYFGGQQGGTIDVRENNNNSGGNIFTYGGSVGNGGHLITYDGGGSLDTSSGYLQLGDITLSKGRATLIRHPDQAGNTNINLLLPSGGGTLARTTDLPSVGSTTRVAYADNGDLAYDADFTWIDSTRTLRLGQGPLVNNTGILILYQQGQVRYAGSGTNDYIALRAPADLLDSTVFTLPTGDGTSGQVLTTDGSTNMSWTTIAGGGSITIGSVAQIPFSNTLGNDFDYEAALVYLQATNTLRIGETSASGNLSLLSEGQLSFYESGSTNYIGLRASGTFGSDILFNLPTGYGISGQVLSTKGNGELDWVAGSSLSLGSANQVAFINPGATDLAYATAFTYVSGDGALQLGESSNPGIIRLGFRGEAQFYETNNGNYVSFKTPSTFNGNTEFILPSGDGTSGQVLMTDGSEQLFWGTAAGATLGSANRIPYMNAGATDFDYDANFQWDDTDRELSLGLVSSSTTGIISLRHKGQARFYASGTSRYLGFQAPNVLSNPSLFFTFPSDDGGSGQAITTNGAGQLSWSTFTNLNLGADTQVPFMNGTTDLAYDADFTWDSGSRVLTLGSTSAQGIISLRDVGEIRLYENNDDNYVGFTSPTELIGNTIFTLPTGDGTSGQGLTTDGSTNLSWSDLQNLSLGTVTQIPYCNGPGSDFSYEAGFIYINSTNTLQIGEASSSGNINLLGEGRVTFYESGSTNYVSLKAAETLIGNTVFILPTGDGVSGQALTTDGSANLSWETVAGGGVSFGSAQQMPFMNAGGTDFSYDADITWDSGNRILTLGSTSAQGIISLRDVGELRIYENNNNNYVGFTSPTNLVGDTVFVLPTGDGTSGQVLSTDGSTNLSWEDTQSLSLGTAAQVPYCNGPGSDFSYESEFLFLSSTNSLYLGSASSSGNILLFGEGRIRFYESGSTNYVELKAAENLIGNTTFILPTGDGASGEVLATDGSANLEWVSAGGGGSVSFGSADQVPFTNAGGTDFDYDSHFTWDSGTNILQLGTQNTRGRLRVRDRGEVHYYEDNTGGSNYIALRCPQSISSTITLELPGTVGTSGEVLTSDGAGGMHWEATGSPGSSDNGQIACRYLATSMASNAIDGWTDLEFDTSDDFDSSHFSIDSNTERIYVKVDGNYMVTAQVTVQQTEGSANNAGYMAELTENGTRIGGSRGYMRTRGQTSSFPNGTTSLSRVINLSSGDYISIQAQRFGSAHRGTFLGSGCSLNMAYLGG